MKIAVYWGSGIIMAVEAKDEEEFTRKVLDHVEKYWRGLESENFSKAWQEIVADNVGTSGRFHFFRDDI